MLLTQGPHSSGRIRLPSAAPISLRDPRRLALVGFGVVGAGMVAFTLVAASVLPSAHTVSDEAAYLQYARNLLQGTYAVASQQREGLYLWHTPALPLIIAPLLWLKLPLGLIRMIGPICVIGAGLLLTQIMRRFVDPRLAVAGGLLLCLYPPFWRLLPRLFVEPLALAVCLAGFEALMRAYERRQLRWAAIAGLAFGYMVLSREEYGWLAMVGLGLAVLALLARPYRAAVAPTTLALLVTALVCVPWLGYTYSRTHVPFFWSAASGESLYWMSSGGRGETGSWEQAQSVFTNPHLASHRALFMRLEQLPQLQSERELTRIALGNIEQHPSVYARHVLDNAERILLGVPFSFQTDALTNLAFYGLPDVVLVLGFGWSVWQLRRRRVGLPRRLVPILVFGAVGLAWHLPAAAYPRMATLSVPAVVLVIALGVNARVAPAPDRVAA